MAQNDSSDSQNPSQTSEDSNNSSGSKLGAVLAIVAGLIVIVVGVVTYNYFNDSGRIGEIDEGQIAPVQIELDGDFEGILTGDEDVDFEVGSQDLALDIDDSDDSSGIKIENTDAEEDAADNADDDNKVGILQKLRDKIFVTPESTDETIQIDDGDTSETAQETGSPEILDEAGEPQTFQPTESVSVTSTQVTTVWTPNNYSMGDILGGEYVVKAGDTLWEIAEGYYGDGTQWKKIADANNVGYLANGNPLIMPEQRLTLP